MSEIISIVNQKRRVGKTTTAVDLSTCFASSGYRILLVNFDPKDNVAVGFGFGIYDIQAGWYELLTSKKNMVLDTMIPRNVKLAECAYYGKPVLFIDKNCKESHSYMELTIELLNQNGTVESSLAKSELAIAEHY
jgi:cellulose biosynthesis protein BcsQ